MKSISPALARLLGDATRLTRSGRLKEATAAIQRALGGTGFDGAAPGAGTTSPSGSPTDWQVLEGCVTELRPPPPPPPQPGQGPVHATDEAFAHFAEESYTAAAGTRSYKLYRPSGTLAQPLPLLVMLHGCTQNPDDFAAGTRMNELAESQRFYVLYPAQARRSNASRCWNWFNPNDQARGRGEAALLAGMTRHVMQTCAVDPARVYVAGLSAGGAMAAIMGREYPDLFAAVGVHSGLPPGAASDVASAFAAMKSGESRPPPRDRSRAGVPTIVFHGDDDATVHPRNGEHVIADQLHPEAAGRPPDISRSAAGAGHRYTRTVYRDSEGVSQAEHWEVHGAGHAWSGGSAEGSYTDARGPDASAEMLRFFLEHPHKDRR